MKKKIGYIFLLIFSFLSFYITYKTANFIKQVDVIMKKIKETSNDYNISRTNGIINGDTIIPGVNGLKVNIDKSYNKMKKVGFFSDKLLVYDILKNNNLLADNLDKYIIKGSNTKKGVSILLFLDDKSDKKTFNKLINYPLNIIVNYNYYLDNEKYINNLIKRNYNVLIYSISEYNIKNFTQKIKILPQKKLYCFNNHKDEMFKNLCMNNNYYSILNENNISNNYLQNIKKNLKNGEFIVLKGSYENELVSIINYIDSKGYDILNLDSLLDENIKI